MAGFVALYFVAALVAVAWTSGGNVARGTWRNKVFYYYDPPTYTEAAVVNSSEGHGESFRASMSETNSTESPPDTPESWMALGNEYNDNNVLTERVDQTTLADRNVMGSKHWCWMLRYLGVALWNASRNICECMNCKDEKDYCGYHTTQGISSSFSNKQRRRYPPWERKYYPRHGCQNGGTYRLDEAVLSRDSTANISEPCTCGEHTKGRCCEQLVCRNGGKAFERKSECLCPAAYAGRFCEDSRFTDCENDGRLDVIMNKCECTKRFWGARCENRICENGEMGQYGSCKCDSGYSGQYCEREQIITSCSTDGRLVRDAPGGNRCDCDSNWFGRLCERPKCQNGGRENTEWRQNFWCCICKIHYYGRFCEKKIQCANGFSPHPKENRCNCRTHRYEGPRCDIPICRNGGWAENSSHCSCPPHWRGNFCDERRCANGGVVVHQNNWYDHVEDRHRYDTVCKCSKYYKGTFCTELTGVGGVLFFGLPVIGILMAVAATAALVIAKKKGKLSGCKMRKYTLF